VRHSGTITFFRTMVGIDKIRIHDMDFMILGTRMESGICNLVWGQWLICIPLLEELPFPTKVSSSSLHQLTAILQWPFACAIWSLDICLLNTSRNGGWTPDVRSKNGLVPKLLPGLFWRAFLFFFLARYHLSSGHVL
jgi:hypothetical protein